MAFTVYLSSDEGINHGYGDKDRYELSAAGTLVVRPADGTETYTYLQWVYLKADTDHTSGGPKSGSGKATAGEPTQPTITAPINADADDFMIELPFCCTLLLRKL